MAHFSVGFVDRKNNRPLKFKEKSIMQLLDKVKLPSFLWPKAKYINFFFLLLCGGKTLLFI